MLESRRGKHGPASPFRRKSRRGRRAWCGHSPPVSWASSRRPSSSRVLVERRRRRPDALTPEQLKELGDALDEAIDDLRRDPDPRRAVIAAYARMEQALTLHGFPRRPSEAPYEYLSRVARDLEAEQPVAALTELFEVAKFSEHSVDEAMRGRAIDALTAVRREVRTAAT